MSTDTALCAARRTRELDELFTGEHAVDVVVIGGGVTGTGIALDAASRGLDTVLLESHDLAHGTSRWSSKLAHGGLRYLASGDIGIARSSAVERGILLERTAPHLVRALAQVIPFHRGSKVLPTVLSRVAFYAGDLLGRMARTPRSALPSSRTVRPEVIRRWVPGVRRAGLVGGAVNWDCQLIDDAKLVTGLARTAAGHGARILTRCHVERATGNSVEFTDTITGERHELSARAVINATGVWAGTLADDIHIRPSRGTHLVVHAEALGRPEGALTVAVPGSFSRFCFCLPVDLDRVFVGLTDVDAPGAIPDVPTASDDEIDFLLDVVGRALERPLTRDDVLATFSGLRPLIDSAAPGDADGETADLSRRHAILTDPSGLVTVTGGKLTEYRRMAEEVVDRVVAASALPAGRCRTRALPLVGAPGTVAAVAAPGPLPRSLVARFGAEAPHVVAASVLERPLEQVAPGIDVTRAEFSFAATHEGALTADDILDRCTRVGLVPADRAAASPAAVEAIAAVR